ncbi:uncharacterized protein YecE (DUF72 family) [Halopolyspora algeriensis]|uniref:Uncharacterized protein YecE (DUF72 family) n=1 Tax=Halopolyspora algeriensis TaxID=1500506 RepID=A0A368VWP7_9ACTN|nr:DUF72 domain-containing protein [Halopolyspora algeriensis]RCW45790.1 uncharacterized protein YecE (DUF72 family) [Halopolyspora algeriensis]TQM54174.1 uncharacterized protein YecE (DUF72 family) [Halopolyspora algeriensis]
MGELLVGTASWTDRTLIASGWYPPEANTPAKRLEFYAGTFPLAEVDATYYGLPAERTAALWVQRTPEHFTFNVKAFSLFTQHPTKPSALPKDLRSATEHIDRKNVYLRDLDPHVVDELWQRFLGALAPLYEAGKLGAILLQFPQWFPIGRTNKQYLLECRDRVAPMPVCVEFRNYTWMQERNREETLEFLSSHGLPYVVVDMPQGHTSSIPPVVAATADLAVVRFHGRSERWTSRDIEERFGYKYSHRELAEWAPRLRELADSATTTHVVMNNCYRDYAQTNAADLAELVRTAPPPSRSTSRQ